jgi:hypothetical protein
MQPGKARPFSVLISLFDFRRLDDKDSLIVRSVAIIERGTYTFGGKKQESMGSIRCQGDVARQCIGLPNRTRVEKRDSFKRFSTFTHVMRADADSQEKLLDLVSETLDRAVLYSDYLNVSFQYSFT